MHAHDSPRIFGHFDSPAQGQQVENQHFPETAAVKRPEISPEFRAVLRDHYRKHNANLANFLGRDLSIWQ
jgi:hypothetical protein